MAFMKGMKSARKSRSALNIKIARGFGAKARVLSGKKEKTVGRLTKRDLKKNKQGRVVSKRVSEKSKETFKTTLRTWNDACKAARKKLNVTGFVPVKGQTAQGKALYATAKSMMRRDIY